MTLRFPARRGFRFALSIALVPLALGLASCKKEEGETPAATEVVAPLAKVAPPAGKAWADTVEVTPDGGYRMGNPDAKIKLVEYGSLSCPHCAALAQAGFEKLRGDYVASGRVSLEFRSFAIHPIDVPLTVLASCGDKESFFPLVEQIYANFEPLMNKAYEQNAAAAAEKAMTLPDNQRFVAVADAQGLTQFFAERGVSTDQARSCLSNFAKANTVAEHAKAYGEQGIESTPTLLINGVKVDGNSWDLLEAALQRAGAR